MILYLEGDPDLQTSDNNKKGRSGGWSGEEKPNHWIEWHTAKEVEIQHALHGALLVVVEQCLRCTWEELPCRHGCLDSNPNPTTYPLNAQIQDKNSTTPTPPNWRPSCRSTLSVHQQKPPKTKPHFVSHTLTPKDYQQNDTESKQHIRLIPSPIPIQSHNSPLHQNPHIHHMNSNAIRYKQAHHTNSEAHHTKKKMHLIPTLSQKSTFSLTFTNVKETDTDGRITSMGKKGSENAGKSQWHCYCLWGKRVVCEQKSIVLDVLYLVGELARRGVQIWAAADQTEERKMVGGGEGFGKKRGEQRRAFPLEQ